MDITINCTKKGLSAFFGGLRYSGFGAIGSDTTYNNYVVTIFDYIQLNLGLEQEIYESTMEMLNFIQGLISTGLMVAKQVLNNVYDISGHEDFEINSKWISRL